MPTDIAKLKDFKIYIQDKEYIVRAEDVTPTTNLNSYIRDTLQLTGTKSLCFEGGCGSCIVVLYSKNSATNKETYKAINSCLVPVLSCSGWRIYTVEGIGNPIKGYHPVQEALARFNGTQCGFCSPGMVMNMFALYESNPNITMAEIENSFGGNICRCTGYRPILSAFKSLASDASKELLGTYPDIEDMKVCRKEKCEQKCGEKCTNEEPYAHELAAAQWIKIYSLQDLLDALRVTSGATYRLVAGNTAHAIFPNYAAAVDFYIDVTSVPELLVNEVNDTTFVLGACTSLTVAMAVFNQVASDHPQFAYLQKLAAHIDLVANVPVRNIGTIAGNLMMKHDNHLFPSDVFLILETVGAVLTVVDVDMEQVQLSPRDFIDYDMNRKVLTTITFPSYPDTVQYVSYKIMPRAQNSHAHVNAGFLFKFNANDTLTGATLVYGNINPSFIHATNSEKLLVGKDLFNNATLQQVYASLKNELKCDVIPPDPTPEFRSQLAVSLFYKAVLSIAPTARVASQYQSGGTVLERPVSSGAQDYQTNESLYPLTQPIPKIEALALTTGQAQYIRDIPNANRQLFGGMVLSEAPPTSTIRSIDPTPALDAEGIVAFFGAKDIPGLNSFTPSYLFAAREEIFCSGRILFYQQPVGIILGTSYEAVMHARNLVTVTYNPPTDAPLLSSRQVVEAGKTDRIIETQHVEPTRTGKNVDQIVTGTFDIYHQAHFHMETQCCTVIPTEDGLDVFASTQTMNQVQIAISQMLNISNNQVNVIVRRLGGGFGAKISRIGLVSCAAALAAWKLRQPVKLFLTLPENLAIIGKRWPLSSDYEVGVSNDGVIQYLNCTHYSDLGAVYNETSYWEVMGLFRSNYINDTFDIHMNVVVTDTAVNTYARAPGSTEGLGAIESIMEHLAYEINMDPLDLRLANIWSDDLREYINDLRTWANIDQRRQEIAEFNQENRWKKRGISVVPMIYNIGYPGPFVSRVTIFHGDGTVQISHGGIEMGQGINTKVAQVCAYRLGLSLNMVRVLPSHTFIAHNNPTSGGSITSEVVCYATLRACDELNNRLQPYKDRDPNASWVSIVNAAKNDQVHLSADGVFTSKDVRSYAIYGVGASEVIVDVLTGQHLLTRVDILEDTGQTMSPLVDIGQVEGAFIMGASYYTSERIVFDDEGKVITNSTWTYYPLGAKDIPVDFRIRFPRDNPNPAGVLGSKATAEPPLCLSISVPLAIRNALASARTDASPNNDRWFPVDGPTTVENTFMNSVNDSSQYVL